MIEKYQSGIIDDPSDCDSEEEQRVISSANKLIELADEYMEQFKLQSYLKEIINLETVTNRYIENTQPFKLAKDPARQARLSQVLSTCAEAVRIILLYLRPVMPEKAEHGLKMLGVDPEQDNAYRLPAEWGGYRWTKPVKKGPPLFPRRK